VSLAEDVDLFWDTNSIISSSLRGFIQAPQGRKFIVCDFAAIEARVLAWLAGQESTLHTFRTHGKVYESEAAKIYGVEHIENVTKAQRGVGKTAILALGYQGGLGAFRQLEITLGLDLGLDDEEVEDIKKSWRAANEKIVLFWDKMLKHSLAAVRNPGKVFKYRGIAFVKRGSFLWCRLPSGRTLKYPYPTLKPKETPWGTIVDELRFMGVNSTTSKWERQSTYGGKLVENCWASDTKVLTNTGVKSIIHITREDKVWDGIEWVAHEGFICQGKQKIGNWLGTQVTENHKILVGSLWKKVIDLDEKCTQDALKKGVTSVPLLLLLQVLVTTARQFVNVRVGGFIKSIREHCSGETPFHVQNVAIQKQERKDKNTNILFPILRFYIYGLTGSQVWFPDVITKDVKPIKIMAPEVLKYTLLGFSISNYFWSTSRLLKIGIPKVWNSIELKIMKGTAQGILELFQVKLMLEIKGILDFWFIKTKSFLLWIFGKSIVQNGKAIMHSIGILKQGKHRKKLWISIKKVEKVYDLKNCGPRKRFTIFTNRGPVITHNCTQAVARDLLAESMFRVEEKGYTIIFSVHDELVIEVPEDFGTVKEVEELMCVLPSWAEGLPLAAEGFECVRYRK